MISITPKQVAEKIKAMSCRSLTGIASRVRPDSLGFLAAQIANSGEWIPPEVGDEVILIRLRRLCIAFPDRFFPEIPND